MTLVYTLLIDTANAQPKQVLEALNFCSDVAVHTPQGINLHSLFECTHDTGLKVQLGRYDGSNSNFLVEKHEIYVSTAFLFSFDKFRDYLIQRTTMIEAIARLLLRFSGDAMLTFNGEIVWLIRKKGILILNKELNFWSDTYLKLFQEPYSIETITSE